MSKKNKTNNDSIPMLFAKNILLKKPIEVFNNGNLSRDFTYIDDIVEGVYRCSREGLNGVYTVYLGGM